MKQICIKNGFVYLFLLPFEISHTMYLRVSNYSNSTPIDNSIQMVIGLYYHSCNINAMVWGTENENMTNYTTF